MGNLGNNEIMAAIFFKSIQKGSYDIVFRRYNNNNKDNKVHNNIKVRKTIVKSGNSSTLKRVFQNKSVRV